MHRACIVPSVCTCKPAAHILAVYTILGSISRFWEPEAALIRIAISIRRKPHCDNDSQCLVTDGTEEDTRHTCSCRPLSFLRCIVCKITTSCVNQQESYPTDESAPHLCATPSHRLVMSSHMLVTRQQQQHPTLVAGTCALDSKVGSQHRYIDTHCHVQS